MPVGVGYDVHRLVKGRPLVLGGVEIPFPRGLQGHSDADVLIHAIMDALLGAAALGDIGQLFPDSDPHYQGASSLGLLQQVGQMIDSHGWRVDNIDATVVAEEPRLASYIPQMKAKIAQTLGMSRVGIKATTSEGLGFVGRGEGIAALAVASLERSK